MTNETSDSNLDYTALMQQAWGAFTRKPVELIIGMLVACMSAVFIITAGAAGLGMSHQALEAIRGRDVTISTALDGYNSFAKALVLAILLCLIIGFGLLLCVLPGLFAMFMLCWTFMFMADDPALSPTDAMKQSFELSKRHPVPVLVLFVVNFLLSMIGGIVVVGTIVTLPLTQLFAAAVFEALRAKPVPALPSAVEASAG
jgi:uncharacterized membrane protein